jgi:endonuclease YncB( thermonuclease family)
MKKTWIHLWGAPLLGAMLSGCTLLQGPEPQPTPTPVPTPGSTVFDPNDGIVHGVKLNDPGNAKLPDAFQVAEVLSPELITIRSVKGGAVVGGPPEEVRVAGIVAPLPGQPGFDQALLTVANWTRGEVSIEQDPKFPRDLQGRRYVQVFFKGTGGATKDQELSLNRMLVRSGYAVVDLHSPSTFTHFEPGSWTWYNDEQYARQHHLGLWGQGIILAQRLPPPAPTVAADTANADNVTVQTGVQPPNAPAPNAPAPNAPAAPNAGAPSPGAPNPAAPGAPPTRP